MSKVPFPERKKKKEKVGEWIEEEKTKMREKNLYRNAPPVPSGTLLHTTGTGIQKNLVFVFPSPSSLFPIPFLSHFLKKSTSIPSSFRGRSVFSVCENQLCMI